jgi:hypothetical protein
VRWFLLSLVVIFGTAQSQEPAPGPSKGAKGSKSQAAKSKQKATQDQRGTANAPLVVNILPTKKSEAEAAQETKDREDKASDTRFAFWFNFLLVSFNGILAVSTVLLWIVTGRAANAAKKSADIATAALIATRPYISIKTFKHQRGIDQEGKHTAWVLTPQWRNTGQTPALNCINWFIVRVFEPTIPKDFSPPPHDNLSEAVSVVVGQLSDQDGGLLAISNDNLLKASQKKAQIAIWGAVEYNDIFPNTPRHHTKYCAEIKVTLNDEDLREAPTFTLERFGKHNSSD